MKIAFVFPGQGAQQVGMGKALFDESKIAKQTFQEADDALNEPFSSTIFDGPASALTLTANTQPAILTVSIAALRSFQEICTIKPDFVAGHSLGEYSALVASGAMEFADAVRTTRARGTFMQEAVPPGQGAMAAIMKLDAETVRAVCLESSRPGASVSPANFNSPGQIVISGNAEAVKTASSALKERGGRAIPLKVSAPFHCDLMAPAADRLRETLENVTIGAPVPPVVTNVTARDNRDADTIKQLLVEQVVSPVLWTESVTYMIDQGVDTFVELGPGTVLAGLISKTNKNVTVISAGTPEGLDKAKKVLEKAETH